MLKHPIKLCFIDTETTGLKHYKNGILQIAFIIVIDGVEKERHNLEVAPFKSDEIEHKALEVNGINIDTIYTRMVPEDALKILEGVLAKYVDKYNTKDKFFFVAYNASFDEGFMREWFKKCGSKYFGSWFWSQNICVMNLANLMFAQYRPSMENFKLSSCLKLAGIEPSGSLHDGMVDIDATMQLFNKLTNE